MTSATRLRACDDAPSKHQPIPCNQQGGLHRMVTSSGPAAPLDRDLRSHRRAGSSRTLIPTAQGTASSRLPYGLQAMHVRDVDKANHAAHLFTTRRCQWTNLTTLNLTDGRSRFAP